MHARKEEDQWQMKHKNCQMEGSQYIRHTVTHQSYKTKKTPVSPLPAYLFLMNHFPADPEFTSSTLFHQFQNRIFGDKRQILYKTDALSIIQRLVGI